MKYRDFELQIGPRSGEGFLLRVLASPAGQAQGMFELPLAASGLRHVSDRARGLTLLERTTSGAIDPRQIGGELFRAVFSGSIGALLHQSLPRIDHESATSGLRIRLRMDPRDRSLAPLWCVPWELLYREDTDDFLALSRLTPIVRALDIPRPTPSDPAAKPLRILLVKASVPEMAALALGAEAAELESILGRDPDIEVSVLDRPDSRSLRRALDSAEFHVLHYMGHGVFEPGSGEGALLLCDRSGGHEVVSARHLATKLKDFPSLRLVLLNACDTAKSSNALGHDPFSGVATGLVLAGIPAVVAMQTPIEDACAVAFSTAFYERLVRGGGVDEALIEGRQALYSLTAGGIDWAIPVLFLRAPSGDLFAWERASAMPADAPMPRAARIRWLVAGFVMVLALAVALGLQHWARSSILRFAEGGVAGPTLASMRSTSPAIAAQPVVPRSAAMVEGPYLAHFHVVGAAQDSAFLEALRTTLRRLSSSPGFGGAAVARHVYVELSRPAVSLHEEAGLSWRVCRISATCRVESGGRVAHLGSISTARSHVDARVACAEAASALAEAVVDKFVGYVGEARP